MKPQGTSYGTDDTPSGDRVHGRFPVTVVSTTGFFFKSAVRGWAEYYDQGGLFVKADKALPKGKRVDIRFKAPATLCPTTIGVACDFPGEVISSAQGKPSGHDVQLKWSKPLPKLVNEAVLSHYIRVGSVTALVVLWMLWLRWTTLTYFWYDPFLYAYTMAVGLFYLSRFYFTVKHVPPPLKGYTPSISVIVSVRNEEKAIGRTVDTLFAADYPEDKREVIVVNDGSTDGTPKVLEGLKIKYPTLQVFSIPPSGKRHGMATGFRAAKNELLVVVDSDTFVDRLAFKHLVCGFEDKTLGAVSGFSGVENTETNLLTRMQDVRYVLSYELMKAPESLFDAVTCCPGVLSAYRREYLMKILDKWLNQTFLGAPATFGDDRSLTNYILRDYRVRYNPMAISTTLVPETLGGYLRQQVRWKKSWLRETMIAATFMHTKHPIAVLSFYAAALCSLVSPLIVLRAAYWALTGQVEVIQNYGLGLILLGLSMGLFVLFRRPHRRWYLCWLLVGMQVIFMGPQTYYAILTMRKNQWGTR